MIAGDRVPMFRLRPYRGLLMIAMLVALIGGLLSLYFFVEDSWDPSCRRFHLTLLVTGILVFLLVVVAYSRYFFRHLHHHRPGYKSG